MKHIVITICSCVLLTTTFTSAEIYNVPEDYPTIQAAIDTCRDFDEVVIATGQHSGAGNYNLNLRGKRITVRSANPDDSQTVKSTIIDCKNTARAFTFNMAETRDSIITGLTITNGYASLGGAIYCYNNSSPTIKNLILHNNSAVLGGAITLANSNTVPLIGNCIIANNSALVGGGAIYSNGASPEVKNCIIAENESQNGAAFYTHNPGTFKITNCTISSNKALTSAGGIYCNQSCNITICNTILWGNSAPLASELLLGSESKTSIVKISYCDIQNPDETVVCTNGSGITWGQGNIQEDPDFTQPESGITLDIPQKYSLLENSTCINAGNSQLIVDDDEKDIHGEPRISGDEIDIGADEYQLAIQVTIRFTPPVLNMNSNAKFLNCFIQLPDNYNSEDILPETITIYDKVAPAKIIPDDDPQKLLVKFPLVPIKNLIDTSRDSVTLTVKGELNDGISFKGTGTIKILQKTRKQNHKR